jgi:hypothetical protein
LIRTIVPFTPGTATDIIARTVFELLSERLGQSIIVENRTGAGGTIGATLVAKADPDGYTILVNSSSHTIIPSLVTRAGRSVMPFGVMGGQYQPVGQVHVLTNMLDYGCDVQEAIDMPRGLHYEGVYQLEDGVPAAIVEGLKKLGHQTTSVVGPLGGGQAIWIDWDKGTLTGGSDPRKDGCALGY